MNVNVQIQLTSDESASDLSGNATEIAEKILEAVGGNPEKDMVYVTINNSGNAGAMTTTSPAPTPIPPPTPPPPPTS